MVKSSRRPHKGQSRLYDWGDGKGKVHSIALKQHKDNIVIKREKREDAKRNRANNTPVFPGGITTMEEFRNQRKAAVAQEFGSQDAEIQSASNQVPAWYEDYLKKLSGLQTQTTEQFQGLQAQAGSLAEKAADATPEGQKAAESRNQIVKAIQGALIQQQGAAFTRNQEMVGVATGQRNARLSEIGQAKSELAKKKGAFASTWTGEHRQTEFENALAAKQFGIKLTDSKTKAAKAAADAKKAANPGKTTYDQEFAKQAAKYGFSRHDWALLGPTGRARKIAEAQARSGAQPKSIKRIEKEEATKIATRNGYTLDEWRALTPKRRSEIIHGKSKPGSDPKDKGTEFAWVTPNKQAEQGGKASKAGKAAAALKKKGKTRQQAAQAILGTDDSPDPTLVSAALDAVYEGHLSREVARRLQRGSHLKATDVARALGTLTYTEWRRKAARQHSRLHSRSNSRSDSAQRPGANT